MASALPTHATIDGVLVLEVSGVHSENEKEVGDCAGGGGWVQAW